ncbi:Oidioi.mRNA.OKI2018_I69.PAR.g12089.t1.cds [Oikopleura dioica]|uniref:Oidioi.mRNA.OKI2018_I69.PAR.g12089.t1.cds n=1 Tax=Oikopleura dioica TaxID=34765 RepID=A0ABN7S2B1_OIKDI|nr:Oidioi.mRNA.OKI2018_I69.PAR.g12089.t1.cds [Oikopleura dioica]
MGLSQWRVLFATVVAVVGSYDLSDCLQVHGSPWIPHEAYCDPELGHAYSEHCREPLDTTTTVSTTSTLPTTTSTSTTPPKVITTTTTNEITERPSTIRPPPVPSSSSETPTSTNSPIPWKSSTISPEENKNESIRNSSRYGSGSRIYHGEFSGGRYAANRSTRHMRRDDRYFQAQQQQNANSTLQYQRLVNEEERKRREMSRQREEQTRQHEEQQRLQRRLEQIEMEERRQQEHQPPPTNTTQSQTSSEQQKPRPTVTPKQCAPPRRFSWLNNRSRDTDDDESDSRGNWSTASSNNRSTSKSSSFFRMFSFRKKKASEGQGDTLDGSIVRDTTTLSEDTPPERRPTIPDDSPPTYASINFDVPASRGQQEQLRLSITTDESDVDEYESPKLTGAQAAAEMDQQWKRSTLSICSEKSSSSSDVSSTTMGELLRLNLISSEESVDEQQNAESMPLSQEENCDQKKVVKTEVEEEDKHEVKYESPVNTSTPISAVRANPRLTYLKRREMPVPPSPLASNSFDGRLNTIVEDSSDEEKDAKDSPTLTKLLNETRAKYHAMKNSTVKGETKPYASLTADSPMTLKFKTAAADKPLEATDQQNRVLMPQVASVSVSQDKDNVADKENMKPIRQDSNSNYTDCMMHVTPSDDEFFSFDSITSPAEFSKSLMAPSRFTPRDLKEYTPTAIPKKETVEEESDDSDVDVVNDDKMKEEPQDGDESSSQGSSHLGSVETRSTESSGAPSNLSFITSTASVNTASTTSTTSTKTTTSSKSSTSSISTLYSDDSSSSKPKRRRPCVSPFQREGSIRKSRRSTAGQPPKRFGYTHADHSAK